MLEVVTLSITVILLIRSYCGGAEENGLPRLVHRKMDDRLIHSSRTSKILRYPRFHTPVEYPDKGALSLS